jgi:hypothetical protein
MTADVFQEPLPVIGISPAKAVNVLGVVAHTIQDIQRYPAASLQRLVQQVKSSMGVPSNSSMVRLEFSGDMNGVNEVVFIIEKQFSIRSSTRLFIDFDNILQSSDSPGNHITYLFTHDYH